MYEISFENKNWICLSAQPISIHGIPHSRCYLAANWFNFTSWIKMTFDSLIFWNQVNKWENVAVMNWIVKQAVYKVFLEQKVSLRNLQYFIAGSLEAANSSILAARRLFKDLVGKKIRI